MSLPEVEIENAKSAYEGFFKDFVAALAE